MNLRNIIWTSVIASVASVGAIVAGVLGNVELVLALGLAGIISATLGNKE